MRITAAVAVLVLLSAGAASAQEWDEFTSIKDGFRINFPGQPKETAGNWTSQMNYTLPMRVYSAEKGRERYSITVVDYNGIEQMGIERAKTCPPGNQNCRANCMVSVEAPCACRPAFTSAQAEPMTRIGSKPECWIASRAVPSARHWQNSGRFPS